MNKKSKLKKVSITFIIIFIVFVVYGLSLIIPILWSFMSSFKDPIDFNNNRTGLLKEWLFSNYPNAFNQLSAQGSNMFIMMLNSIWFSFGGTMLGIISSSLSAYVIAKYKFRGRNFIYGLSLVTMMLPIVGALPSQYKVYHALGILNSPLFLVTFANGLAFNFVVLYAYFKSLPTAYMEASFMDGAGHFKTFIYVMLPMAFTVIGSLFVVAFIGNWNEYMKPLLFLKSYPTLSSGLYLYQQSTMREINIPMLFAGVFMSITPTLLLFIIFQDKIMNLSVGGGLKG
ncbi:MAG: carbohydrate ABC transporter permease [Acholeplasmataceae bacterium]|nr:carbohydrate ABC transporter permease [Acholeplasmataceae bacterium]